jgi:hypothetical protein
VTIHARTGLWFEELTVGDSSRHGPGRTVTEADHALFSARGRNERDETVCTAVRAALVRCREASTRQIDEREQSNTGRDA